MLTNFTIDTGAPRHIQGHLVSGILAAGVVSATLNYQKQKAGEITTKDALSNTARLSVQGGLATASAISAANCMGRGNWFGAVLSLSAGALGIYATEKFYNKIDEPKSIAQEVK